MLRQTASDIARQLAVQVESVAAELLPGGKRSGRHWVAGNTRGDPGESLKVVLSGSNAGQWSDFANDEDHGDLVDLWAKARGLSISQALVEAKQWLGIPADKVEPVERKRYRKVAMPKGATPERVSELEARGIAADVVDRYGVWLTAKDIVFPSYWGDRLVALKYRQRGAKKFRQEAGQRPALFGWQAIPKTARAVVICEGEIDALTWATWGVPALSVPMGGGGGRKQETWIAEEYDHLDRFDEIFVHLDEDKTGQEGAAAIIQRLGRERCRLVRLGFNDANAAMAAGMTSAQAWAALEKAESLDPEGLAQAGKYRDEVLAEIFKPVADTGWRLPWDTPKAELVRWRDGEFILLAGETGHGKSQVLGDLITSIIAQGGRVCGANLEYKPARWLRNFVYQSGATNQPTEQFAGRVVDWLGESLLVYNPTKPNPATILDVYRYAYRRYGATVFFVDNLSKCGIADDDYPGQKAFAEALADFSRLDGITVFLVHHMRKGQDNSQGSARGRGAIKGSGGLQDMAHTVATMYRNKTKERKLEDDKLSDDEREEWTTKPDGFLTIEKQRENGEEPIIALWFDRRSGRYSGSPRRSPLSYVD